MKKLLLTCFTCFMVLALFAQKKTIESFVKGKMSQEVFVEDMMNHFDKYDVSEEQIAKIRPLVQKKAKNYAIIADLKKNNPELFNKKMNAQKSHLAQSLKFILDDKQYRAYMINSRKEYASMMRNQTKDKK